ncbi:MAG: metal ABC transporter substrate-binding protein, partial [Lachnospiraceae bacterium]|nr:metal ABC transporter substrate-binding protein [Lachnospiraceae bacterium]
AGFITLDDDAKQALDASVKNVKEYKKKIKIVEIDAAQIIPTKDDYNAYITNTNRILEAKITPNRLAQESAESPYANIIAVKADNKDNPNIRKLVKVLQSEKVRKFIEDKYDGAVIPAALKK